MRMKCASGDSFSQDLISQWYLFECLCSCWWWNWFDEGFIWLLSSKKETRTWICQFSHRSDVGVCGVNKLNQSIIQIFTNFQLKCCWLENHNYLMERLIELQLFNYCTWVFPPFSSFSLFTWLLIRAKHSSTIHFLLHACMHSFDGWVSDCQSCGTTELPDTTTQLKKTERSRFFYLGETKC